MDDECVVLTLCVLIIFSMSFVSYVQPYYKKLQLIVKGSKMTDNVVLRTEPALLEEKDGVATIEV